MASKRKAPRGKPAGRKISNDDNLSHFTGPVKNKSYRRAKNTPALISKPFYDRQ